jgi:carbonic anhydrase/acetyltransferase-like protein (isoleucine patch superfamily)
MLLTHRGKAPTIHPSAYVAPTATVCGDVWIGPHCQIGFGAVLVAEGSPIVLGESVVVREQALLRATVRHPVNIGSHVLVGPHASLMGCTIENEVFLATGVTVFFGARVGRGAEVRVNGVVHVNTVVGPGVTVPIAWVAVGDPAQLFPPSEHERIWAVQKPLDFPSTVYGVQRAADGSVDMKEIARKLAQGFATHRDDQVVETVGDGRLHKPEQDDDRR